MKKKFYYGFAASFVVQTAFSQVVINEMIIDSVASNDTEFLELYNTGTTAVDISGYIIEKWESDDSTSTGYGAADGQGGNIEIPAGTTLGAGEYYLAGNSFFEAAYPAVTIDLSIAANSFENSSSTYILKDSAGTTLFSVFASDGGVNDSANDAGVGITPDVVTNDLAWALVPNGEATAIAIDESVPSTEATPGAENIIIPALELVLTPTSISESAGSAAIEAEVILPDSTDGDLIVSVTISDNTELSAPVSVTIPDGDDFLIFDVDAVDDAIADGVQSVDVTISAAGYKDATVTVFVSDDDIVLPEVVINEMQVKGDGADPQFVELYNFGSTPVDVSGWSVKAYVSDSADEDYGNEVGSFTIPSESAVTLASGEFYLVGDAIFESLYGISPDLQAEPAFDLFADLTVILFDASDNAVFTALSSSTEETVQANNAGSATVADITVTDGSFSAAGFYLENDGGTSASLIEFTPQPAASATPGTTNTAFIERLRLDLDSTFFSESDGVGVATATITRVNNTSGPLTVTVSSGDASEVVFQSATVEFLDGEETQTVLLDAVDDADEDGIQLVTLTASGAGYVGASASVSVADDESAVGLSDILFTQYYEGTSNNKHVEITNVGTSDISLDGWSLTRWSNAATEDWKTATGGAGATIDLSSLTILAGESVVISNSSAVVPAGITSVLTDSNLNHNGDDSLVLYNGPLNPGNIADSISFTDDGNEGANMSFVRATLDQGWNDTAGSNITDFSSVWVPVDLETVDAAVTGDTNYLGFFAPGVVSDYAVTIADVAFAGGQFVINFTASASSDVYVSTDLESFTLATGGSAVASGTYTDTAPPVGKAFYLIQEAGTPAP